MDRAPTPTTVPALLRDRARQRPDATAIEMVQGGVLTFDVWYRRATAVAHGVRAAGTEPGDRIVLPCGEDWITYPVAYVGVQMAGAVPVPVLASLGEAHAARTAEACGAVGMIGPRHSAVFAGWWRSLAAIEAGQPTTPIDHEVRPEDIAEILYTSGTTGVPKGVAATHSNLTYPVGRAPGGAPHRVLHAIPPGTNAGQGLMVQTLSATPHAMIAQAPPDARGFMRAIVRHRPTDVVTVPALALAMLAVTGVTPDDVASVRMVRSTSAAITPTTLGALADRFPDAAIVNMYSSTESWPARVRCRYDPERPGSIGRPGGGTRVRIAGSDGSELPAGEVGEVQLCVADVPQRRYWGDGEASARVFLPGGWVRTGDLGRLDDDGYLYLHGRADDAIVNMGGHNVSVLQVEAMVEALPGVEEAAVVGLPHVTLGSYVVAAVLARSDFDPEAARAALGLQLGSVAPKRLVVVKSFPRTELGKIKKNALRDEMARMLAAEEEAGPPLTETGRRVARIWSAVLGPECNITSGGASFFELGGSSLDATEVTERVRKVCGRRVPLRALSEARTLAAYAAQVDAAPEDTGPPLLPVIESAGHERDAEGR